ncbi:hypothetical protein WMW72_29895 [Paenibacillus filicis]|uniref:Uncharacterized protein n=1 Tax=Paenibacillus filicis TaxID=669464 RepID=A0ABU9DWG8_9BACL
MKRIYPISEAECKSHYGKPVLIIMHDGSEVYGILSRIEDGRLILGAEEEGGEAIVEAQASAKARARALKKTNGRAGKNGKALISKAGEAVKTSAYPYGPYPYPPNPFFPGRGRFILDLALIALLFVLI